MENEKKTKRDSKGRFAKSLFITKSVFIVLVFAAGMYAYPHVKPVAIKWKNNIQAIGHYDPKSATSTKQTADQIRENDIEARMGDVETRSDFQAQVAKYKETEARKIATEEYAKDQAAEYAKVQDNINKSNEIVKQNEVNF